MALTFHPESLKSNHEFKINSSTFLLASLSDGNLKCSSAVCFICVNMAHYSPRLAFSRW